MNDMPTAIPLSTKPKMSKVNDTPPLAGKCSVAHAPRDPEDMERDFTTPGKMGYLGCPFAPVAQNGLPITPPSHDPIAVEFHQENSSAASQGPLGKCPIRFLDKHAPEEIAQYFENHKHEIPRSHEVCVKRYQHDSNGARALDAKYGNLVNMIQGLGVKHKQYLPNETDSHHDGSSQGAVKKWAEDVSDKVESPPLDAKEDTRASYFDRPLREIRVGESPSRPWGISVPVDNPIPQSALESETSLAQQPGQPASSTPSPQLVGGPAGLAKSARTKKAAAANIANEHRSSTPQLPPQQIVFNGPVFFGYSAEDAAKFLRHLDINDLKPPVA